MLAHSVKTILHISRYSCAPSSSKLQVGATCVRPPRPSGANVIVFNVVVAANKASADEEQGAIHSGGGRGTRGERCRRRAHRGAGFGHDHCSRPAVDRRGRGYGWLRGLLVTPPEVGWAARTTSVHVLGFYTQKKYSWRKRSSPPMFTAHGRDFVSKQVRVRWRRSQPSNKMIQLWPVPIHTLRSHCVRVALARGGRSADPEDLPLRAKGLM